MERSHGESHAEAPAAARFTPGGPQGPGRGPAKGAPNAGRPKDSVRQSALLACEERLELLCDIADGTQQALRPGPNGSWTLVTGSTVDEILKAVLGLAKLGGVEQIPLSQDDDDETDTRTRYGIILMPPPLPKPVPPADGSCWSPAHGYSA